MDTIIRIGVRSKWNGGYEFEATLENGERVKIGASEHDAFLSFIVAKINERGFTLSRGPRQEYQRLTIN